MPEFAKHNVDTAELRKFEAAASRWWDTEGEYWALHRINPLRLDYVFRRAGGLSGLRVLDVGCGGGLLAEAMAAEGARVTGIDMGETAISVAQLHLLESGHDIEYRQVSVEALASERPGQYELLTCMELLEHVPDPAAIVDACARLVKPGGDLVFSTINRNAKAWLMAIVGAEYVLGMVPRGTHEYARLIRPSELHAWARDAGLEHQGSEGLHYDPLTRKFHMGGNIDVNYFMHFRREPE
jgi:2-polyprenyl-6-hydroxyphenyl methylase / 3-demethylubiquinone-9 3-methyltransferase